MAKVEENRVWILIRYVEGGGEPIFASPFNSEEEALARAELLADMNGETVDVALLTKVVRPRQAG